MASDLQEKPWNGHQKGLFIKARKQGNFMRVSVDQKLSGLAIKSSGGIRGRISQFSAASRKRLLEMFACLNRDSIEACGSSFCTLTYGQSWPDPDTAKDHIREFCRRIGRRVENQNPCFIWKMEPQKRGAPHFHIVIFGWKPSKDGWPVTKDDIAKIWGSVIGQQYLDYTSAIPRAPFTRIELIRSWRKLMAYVSKYMAKIESSNPASDQQEGASAPTADSDCGIGFNNVAYLHTDGTVVEYVGRSWGVICRENLPTGEIKEMFFESTSDFSEFHKRVSWRWARIRGQKAGFSIFHDDAGAWFDLLSEYLTPVGVPF